MPYHCAPSFPLPSPLRLPDGSVAAYLGGDGGFTCPLDPTRSVWTLSDAYHAPAGTTRRHGSVVVPNVVGVGTCAGGQWSLSLHAGGAGGKPAPVFDDALNAATGTRFAAQKPFMWGGRLYVLLVRAANGPGRYAPVGSAVARVSNPLDDPARWRVDYMKLWDGRPSFGFEAIVLPPDLLLYGSDGGGRNLPIKLPLAVLAVCPDGGDLSGSLAYWDDSGWRPGVTGPGQVDVGIFTTSGLSITAAAPPGRWLATYCDTTAGDGFPAWISVAMGKSPLGPWSEARRIYPPETADANPLYDIDNALYLPRRLPDFEAAPGVLRVAYVVGSRSALLSGDFSRQLAGLACYRPAVMTAANPFA